MGPGEKLDEKYGTLGLAYVHPQTIQVKKWIDAHPVVRCDALALSDRARLNRGG
jgi:hypothetical protein